MSRNGDTFGETIREVISYQDDVFVWVYLDQIDKVIRYEAYVVGYDSHGELTTLDFVLEEGVLDNVHEVPIFWKLLQGQQQHAASAVHASPYTFTVDGRLVTAPSLMSFYRSLTKEQLNEIHRYFADQEAMLKESRRSRWTRMLRALGYDVIPSL